MRVLVPSLFVLSLSAAVLAAPAQAMKPPREESPAPRENLEAFGSGSSDDELARAIAAANAYPLGSLENPIRVEGPDGAHAYLRRLRCADGAIPKIGARAAGGVGAFGSLVDLFALDCGAAAPGAVTLAFDVYQAENVETRPPAGFASAP